ARGFRVPLVPADEHADVGITSLPHTEAAGARVLIAASIGCHVTRHEVELLVEERIVRDVHLAIHAQHGPVRVYHGSRVPVHAGCLTLEDRGYDDDLQLLRKLLHAPDTGTGDGLREVEAVCRLPLAEVRPIVELLQADDLRPAGVGFPHALHGVVDRALGLSGYGHLHQTYREGHACHIRTPTYRPRMKARPVRRALSYTGKVRRRPVAQEVCVPCTAERIRRARVL